MESSKNLWVGVLAGISVGTVLGLLIAPNKGKITRQRIISKGEKYADDIKEKFGEFGDAFREKGENIKHEAEDQFSKGKNKFEEMKKEAKNINT